MGNESTQQGPAQTAEEVGNVMFDEVPVDEAKAPDVVDAPTDGYPDVQVDLTEQKALADKVPTDEAGETGKAQDDDPAKVETSDEATPTPEEADAAAAAEELAALEQEQRDLENGIAGTEEAEALTNEVLMQRKAEGDRYINELIERNRDTEAEMAEALNAVGRKMIDTAQGKKIVMSDDAKPITADDIDVDRLWSELSDAEQEAFGETKPRAAFQVAVLKVASEYASKVVPTTAQPNDVVISQADQDDVFNSFVTEKMPNGKHRFPDAQSETNKPVFDKVWKSNDPVIMHLHELASKDKLALSALHQLCYEKSFRITNGRLTLAAAAKRLKAEKIKTTQEAATVEGTGGAGGTSGQASAGAAKTDAQKIESLMFAKEDDSPYNQ